MISIQFNPCPGCGRTGQVTYDANDLRPDVCNDCLNKGIKNTGKGTFFEFICLILICLTIIIGVGIRWKTQQLHETKITCPVRR